MSSLLLAGQGKPVVEEKTVRIPMSQLFLERSRAQKSTTVLGDRGVLALPRRCEAARRDCVMFL